MGEYNKTKGEQNNVLYIYRLDINTPAANVEVQFLYFSFILPTRLQDEHNYFHVDC